MMFKEACLLFSGSTLIECRCAWRRLLTNCQTVELLLTFLTLMTSSLFPRGRFVLLIHSSRSRSLSAWVTAIPVISSLICWCHVFLGVLVVWYLVLPGPSLCGWRCSHIFFGHFKTNEDGHCITSSGKSVICVECRCFACDPVSTLQGSREASSPQW